ncbi:hypothetical protein HYPSUDRAFT_308868 [Hypholoma sublateritium FD-334 SS-4]|uniref:Septin-type G domain-containing protein n=1 Tax=Hypholoma sublateritium (strain FD-334 SS-4) TaxID=945553 RepID=A0A0D2PCI1_HYPSF|nr:hypothetical protein HYPSUDRAFT_308868 [Hypholoma sublateritium FD-334 SS-4]
MRKYRRDSAKIMRNLARMTKPEDGIFPGCPNDIVIPVMGPTGVGKSTFINSLLTEGQPQMLVGHSLMSCTSTINPVVVNFPSDTNHLQVDAKGENRRLIIVDTPGFDDTFVDDSEILRRISLWLAQSYTKNMKLAGVIYLHDITQTRMLGTTRRNLDMFRKLVGDKALSAVVLGTTKWGSVDELVARRRQSELADSYWKEMSDAGSRIVQIDLKKSLVLISQILTHKDPKHTTVADEFLMIQEELTEMRKFIPETEAGKTLRYTLEQVIELQRARAEKLKEKTDKSNDNKIVQEFHEGQKRLEDLVRAAKDMKVPFSARIKRFFD